MGVIILADMSKPPRQTFLYIAECKDGSYYTGITADIEKRFALHNSGKGAKYTAARRPVTLVYSESLESLSSALKRERQVKQWTRARKDALVLAGGLVKRKRRKKKSVVSTRKLRGASR
jgi:putative endonuclease